MTNPTQRPACCSEARKRRDEAHAAAGATNSPNASGSATGPENGTQGVEEIRARVEAATPGPWRRSEIGNWIGFDDSAGFFRLFEVRNWATPADVRFVTAARTDIPLLLAELDAANATIARAGRLVDEWLTNGVCENGVYPRSVTTAEDACARVLRAALASPDAGDQR